MKAVKIAELKNHLSEYLREVEQGFSLEVRDRNRPIAHIIPIERKTAPLYIKPAKRPFREVRDKRYPPSDLKIDVVEFLLEDRRKR